MAFSQGSFAKVWRFEDKGKYSVVEMSTSRRDRETDEYKTDFSSKFVKFLGKAHEHLADLQENGRIKITSCAVTVEPGQDGKWYTNFLVYGFENADEAGASSPRVSNTAVEDESDQFVASVDPRFPNEEDDDLPF